MKQKILSAAVAAAIVLPSVASAGISNTIYGDFRWSVNNVDTGGADGWSGNNNASRVGIKGSVGNSSLKAIYHLQAGARNDSGGSGFTSRFYFAGLKGGFGSIVYGRKSTAYKLAGLRVDPFYDTATPGAGGGGFAGVTYGQSGLANGFTNNAIAYTTPVLGGGFTANASIYIDDATADDHDYGIGVQYKNSGITAGVQHLEIDGTGNVANSGGLDSATRFYGSYMQKGKFSVGLSYENADPTVGSDVDFLYVAGTFNVSKKTKLAAAYSNVDDGPVEGDGFTIGAFHSVLPKTTIYALYAQTDLDFGADRDVFSLGVSHKFAISNK